MGQPEGARVGHVDPKSAVHLFIVPCRPFVSFLPPCTMFRLVHRASALPSSLAARRGPLCFDKLTPLSGLWLTFCFQRCLLRLPTMLSQSLLCLQCHPP
jgi:hypothetical protein